MAPRFALGNWGKISLCSLLRGLLLSASLSLVFSACASSGSKPSLFTNPRAVLEEGDGFYASEIVLLDSGSEKVIIISPDGEIRLTLSISTPPGGWSTTRGYWLTPSRGAFVIEGKERYQILPVYRSDTGEYTVGEWQELGPGVLHRWDDHLVTFPYGVTQYRRDSNLYFLPPTPAVLPFSLFTTEFVFLDPPSTLKLWDPRAAVVLYSLTLSAPVGHFTFNPPWLVLSSAGKLQLYEISERGARFLGAIPWEIPILTLSVNGTTEPTLWISTFTEGLLSVYPQPLRGRLCLQPFNNIGASVHNLQFYDNGTLSNPSLVVVASDDELCPGWTPTDLWTLTFMDPPPFWYDLEISPETRIEDLPWGDMIQKGDIFLSSAEPASYTLAATSPLTFHPPITRAMRGVLVPADRFLVHRRNGGYLGFLPLGEERGFLGLALKIQPGSDPPTPYDRFTFTTVAGYEGIGGKLEVRGKVLLSDSRVAVLTRTSDLIIFDFKLASPIKILH